MSPAGRARRLGVLAGELTVPEDVDAPQSCSSWRTAFGSTASSSRRRGRRTGADGEQARTANLTLATVDTAARGYSGVPFLPTP